MKRLLTEPLLHFLLLGAALFVIWGVLGDRRGPVADVIAVPASKVEHLATLFERTWQRPPSRRELEGLVDDYVREEVAYREGMSIGLHDNDTIIRRRIRQKLEFVAEDIAALNEPTDEQLAEYLAAHPDRFHVEPRFTLRQVYVSPDRHGDALEADALAIATALNENPSLDATAMGDPTLMEHRYVDVTRRELAATFGSQFAEAVDALEPGVWHGGVPSAFGAHVVFIEERADGRAPQLEEVWDLAEREWKHDRRRDTIDALYDRFLERYDVVIEWPEQARDEAR